MASEDNIVTEIIDAYPLADQIQKIQRNERLLLTKPTPGMMKFWRDYDLLRTVSFPFAYSPMKFAPPRGVYESDQVRIEWQNMNARQPFYHRNADVDEISYHLTGKRTLMTEKGSVDLTVGDFARIPVSVAHDNRGVEDVHLIFYIPAPVTESVPLTRTTEHKMPPFDGWVNNPAITEMMTECLGGPECDVNVSLTDESMLLVAAKADSEPIEVIRSSALDTSEPEWLYKSELVWIGSTTLTKATGSVYRRHRRADEIQCQVKGRRTLVTQRGTIELEAGDFVSIPLGTSFTDIVYDESTHLSVLTRWPAEPKPDSSKTAKETSYELVQRLRNR